MKNIFKSFCLLGAIVLLTTGCFNYDVEMNINDDKSVDLNLGMKFDMTEFAEQFGEDFDESSMEELSGIDAETKKELEDQGYKVTENKNGYKYNLDIAKKFEDIDEISTDQDIKVDIDKIFDGKTSNIFFKSKKSGFKTIYTAYIIFDLTDEENSEEFNEYKDYLKASYVVNLGDKVKLNTKSTNATEISDNDKKLTWDLEIGKKTEAIYEFEIANSGSMYLMIGCVGLLVLLIAGGFIVIKKQGSKANTTEKTNEEIAE